MTRRTAIQCADSVTDLHADLAEGKLIACGSHGGVISAEFAKDARAGGIVFNDAGVGRSSAGVAGLTRLDTYGIPAGAVSHDDARIGLGWDTLNAPLRHVNRTAFEIGWRVGATAWNLRLPATSMRATVVNSNRRFSELRYTIDCGGLVICVVDSVSLLRPIDKDTVVVTGSHGGLPGMDVRRALRVAALAAVFNDAGIGLNNAGFGRLSVLERWNIAAATVSADSARIGDGESTLNDGRISQLNGVAHSLGAKIDMTTRQFIDLISTAHRPSVDGELYNDI
jgi:hypothetical protein